jgi:hypothetical protein
MPNYLDVVGLMVVATLFGSMTFFSFVVAPVAFIKLDEAAAGKFIRSIFPWYYLILLVLALIGFALLVHEHPFEGTIMGFIAFGAIVSRQILMPRINRYRDRAKEGDKKAEKSFSRLHRLSVWINTLQIIGALFVLVTITMALSK